MKKASYLRACFLFAVYLSFLTLVSQSFANEYVVDVDAAAHQKFGLFYPATYKFSIPPNESGLVAQYRYSPDAAWKTLLEKTSSDTFNGIDAVRFDYANGWAYVSIAFSQSSNHIYLRLINSAGEPVNFTFSSIPRYYDGRKGAVTITLDDWNKDRDQNFRAACEYLTSYGLYYTVAVITGYVDWNSIQQKIDEAGDLIEIASHGVSHLSSAAAYAEAGYEAEIIGSRDAIRHNLRFRGHPYVPVFLEPYGYSDDTLVSTVTAGDYLLTRKASDYFPAGSRFVPWDPVQARYGRSAVVFNDFGLTWDATLVAQSNSLFDQAIGVGGIYHMMNHPRPGYWTDSSYILQHLDYINGRNDLWYAPLGQLYLYHFLQEMRGNLSIRSVETTSLVADFSANPRTATSPPLTVNFTDTSTGTVSGRLWDFGDGTTSTEQNPVHIYNRAGSYTVKLTVSGPDGSNERVQSGYIVVTDAGAAPVADFSAAPRSGTAPLTVNFADESTGAITGWLWDFGDSTTSTDRNPVHLYNSGGTYSVKLTVNGPTGSNQKVRQGFVMVDYPAPVATFSAAPQSGTAPLTVSFTDTSTGSITNWHWNFGDGTTSTSQNPVHVYSSAGSYTVILTVTGPGGSGQRAVASCVVVSQAGQAPVANFSATPRSGTAPLTVSFTDTSTGSITSRLWDFGDGTSSTGQNPFHVYNSPGTYNVKLAVTGPGGSNEKIQSGYVVVSEAVPAPVANFSATPRSGMAPLTVSFTDTSTGSITSRLWDFGDGTSSTGQNPYHVYNSPGTYNVKLAVTGQGGSNEKMQSGYIVVSEAVPAPVANFSATPRSGTSPLTVGFTDTSTGSISSRLWDFGDGTSSTGQNPFHVYNSPGTYNVKLAVTGQGGSNEKVQAGYIVVSNPVPAPVANFSATPRTGTAPINVRFTDASTGSITSRLWDFGDATTSTEINPVHVYNGPGSYTIRLMVTGPGGNNERVEASYIVISPAGPVPVATFSAKPRTGTAPLKVSFTDSTSGRISGRRWDFGDSTYSTEKDPVHIYSSPGSYTVKLTVTSPGGTGEKTQTGYVIVNP